MTPTQTWKKNKWRIDLRFYTRDFQKKFESSTKLNLLPGLVYAAKYRIGAYPTDKHHITPVFISFGRFKDDLGRIHTRGINLFYLRKEQKLEILDEVFSHSGKKPDERVFPLLRIHDKWMKIAPYAFKNFEELRIINICEVRSEEWGMIPLLKDHLIGNFNANALNEDFQEELKTPFKPGKKPKESPVKEPLTEEEENEVMVEDIITSSMDFDDDI